MRTLSRRVLRVSRWAGAAMVGILALIGAGAVVLAVLDDDVQFPWADSAAQVDSGAITTTAVGAQSSGVSHATAEAERLATSEPSLTTSEQGSTWNAASSVPTSEVPVVPTSGGEPALTAQQVLCRDAVRAPIGDSPLSRATHAHTILARCEGILTSAELEAVRGQYDLAIREYARNEADSAVPKTPTASDTAPLPALELYSSAALRQLVAAAFSELTGRGARDADIEDFVRLVHDRQREAHRRRHAGQEYEAVDPVTMAEAFTCSRDPAGCESVKRRKVADRLMEQIQSRQQPGRIP